MTATLSRRIAAGVVTLVAVSILVFAATIVLPGNAAQAILGHGGSPEMVHALELQLHLNRSPVLQYSMWISGLVRGHPGRSFATGQSVWTLVGPRLVNSAVLVALSGVLGTLLALGLAVVAAVRRGKPFDQAVTAVCLATYALPEFVVGIALVFVLSTVVWHVLPSVSVLPPATRPWDDPKLLVLPVATLIIVIVPYIFRMARATLVEALDSEYVEMARLKGLSTARVVLVHALPNAVPPIVQVIGLTFLYLAGGIVVVETVFSFPGIGQCLINAVGDRDIPVIQLIVVMLAAFYVLVNILTDLVALLATPRRRRAR